MTRIFHNSLSAHGKWFDGDLFTESDTYACLTTHLVSMTLSFLRRPSMRSTIMAEQQRQLRRKSRRLQHLPTEPARPRRASLAASITQALWQTQPLLCRQRWPASQAWPPARWRSSSRAATAARPLTWRPSRRRASLASSPSRRLAPRAASRASAAHARCPLDL